MGFDFDITSAPPDKARITAVRAEMAAEHLRLRGLNKRFLIVAVTIVVALVSFLLIVIVPIAGQSSTDGGIVFVIAYSLPYLFFTVFVVGNTMHHHQVEAPRKILETAEEALEEGEQEDIDALFDAYQANAPLGAYQCQVESQGRALFKGELEAMRRWLETNTIK